MNDTTLPLLPSRYELWMTRILQVVGVVFWIVFTLGQLGRVQLNNTVGVYAHDMLAALFLCIWMARERTLLGSYWLPQLDNLFRKHTGAFILAGWIVVGTTLQALLAGDVVPVLYLLRLVMYVSFSAVLCIVASESDWTRRRVSLLPVAVGAVCAWFGILQYLLLPDTRFLATFGWDDHFYRMIGTLFDPNYLGLLLILSAVSTWRVFELGYHKIALTGITAFALLVLPTFSRGSYATALLILVLSGVLALKKNSLNTKKIVVALCTVLLVAISLGALLPKPTGEGVRLLRTSTISARFAAAQQELSRIEGEEWLIGTGLYSREQQSSTLSHARLPDNILVTLIAQTGVIGLVLGSIVLFRTVRALAQFDVVAYLAVVAVLFHSLGTASLLQPFVLLFLLLLVGTRILIRHSEWFSRSP